MDYIRKVHTTFRVDGLYTLEVWGQAQARRYLADLYAMFEAIARGQETGRLIQPDYGVTGRYVRSGKHFTYFYQADGDTFIAEILHERMNKGDHLCVSAHLPARS